MPKVWVKDKSTKACFAINEAAIDADVHTVVKGESAYTRDGSLRAPEYPSSLSSKSGHPAATSGQSADTTEEKSR